MPCPNESDDDLSYSIPSESMSDSCNISVHARASSKPRGNEMARAQIAGVLKQSLADNALLRAQLVESERERLCTVHDRDLLKSELEIISLEVARLRAENGQLRNVSLPVHSPTFKAAGVPDGGIHGPQSPTASPTASRASSSSISMRSFGDDRTGPGVPLKCAAPLGRQVATTPALVSAPPVHTPWAEPWAEEAPSEPLVQWPAKMPELPMKKMQLQTQSPPASTRTSSPMRSARRSVPNCLAPRLISRGSPSTAGTLNRANTDPVNPRSTAGTFNRANSDPVNPSKWPPWPDTDFMRLDWVEPPAPEAMMKAVETAAFTVDKEWEQSASVGKSSGPQHFDQTWLAHRDRALMASIVEIDNSKPNQFEPPQLFPDMASCM